MRSAAQLTKWCSQWTQSLCGRKRAADKELFLLSSELSRCFKERAPGRLFLEPLPQFVKQHVVASIYSLALLRSHVLAPSLADPAGNGGLLFSAAMIGRLAPQPLPACAAKHWRDVLPRARSLLCTTACLHTPSRVAQPRCNASRSLRRRSETHSSGILPSTS